MIPKPLAQIFQSDLQALVDNGVSEGRTLEFKAAFPGPRDEDAREFLYDVTSLANTDGGDLIFGVEDQGGIASSVAGAPAHGGLDATLLRLENLLRDCVQPRLAGVRFHHVELARDSPVTILRIPASFAAPHRAHHKGVGRFFHRNSRGKAEMDVHELRTAFAASEGLPSRLASLHEDAVKLVLDRDLPFLPEDGPRAVLSIIPLGVLREPQELELDHTTAVYPPGVMSFDWLHALEGFYVFDVSEKSRSFVLTRRSGQVDLSWRAGRESNGERLIWPAAVEETLKKSATGAASKLAALGVEGPFAVGLTLLRVKGFKFHHDFLSGTSGVEAWRDRLSLPLIVVDGVTDAELLPLAKSFWYAMGEKRPDIPLGEAK